MPRMAGRSRPPLNEYPARRIALLKPSALGDVVHTLPVLTALRQRYPRAHITWVVNRSYEPLLVGHRDLDATLPFDRGAARAGWWRATRMWTQLMLELRRRCFDLVVDLQGLFRTGLMAAATRAPRRVGLSTAREGASWFYTDVVPVADPEGLHAVDRCWLVAAALGAGHLDKEFHVPLADEARAWAGEALAGCPRPWLVLGVGSRWATKRWPPPHFAALARRARAEFGGTVIFIGAREEAVLSQAVRERLTGPVVDLAGATTLPQLAAILARADAVLANDTGPLHLAAALGRPVVAPYTCTRLRLSGPYGQEAGSVETSVWCRGSYLKRCARMECMDELTPERLWPQLREVLLSWQSRPRSA
jgi:lipopolysaccharide heptosyltransferase I